MDLHFASTWERISDVVPNRTAMICDGHARTWAEYDDRAARFAGLLTEYGLGVGSKVGIYLHNSNEYQEAQYGIFKIRGCPINVNYRYKSDELVYLLDNSDAEAVVFQSAYAMRIWEIRDRLPKVKLFVQVDDGTEALLKDAVDFERAIRAATPHPRIERSPDDVYMLYTGGTTGMPKGVMWTHRDQWLAGAAGASLATGGQAPGSIEEHLANVAASGGAGCTCPCCPMMHGTGLFTAIGTLAGGGTIATLTGASFEPEELFDLVETHQVNALAIVGDAFAKPMLQALDAQPERWDVSSLVSMLSSGVMWSPEVKQGLLRHNDSMVLTDSFGASEAVGFGRSDTTSEGTSEIAKFTLGEQATVFDEHFNEIKPGSDEIGFVARGGAIPLGYYKDPEKTAKTFPTINGVRYSIPGDYCKVAADGTLTLLGRGSVCINTAGEKVYPEEVEEVLKLHPNVADALVVGVSDDKWGQAVTAVVEPDGALEEEGVRAFVRERMAGYKTPKRILACDFPLRAVNGKADYKSAQKFAEDQLKESN